MNSLADRPTPAPLAEVIQLPRATHLELLDGAADAEIATTRAALASAIAVLQRRCGARWVELPASLGRVAATAERLLCDGPAIVDPSRAPAVVLNRARWLLDTTVSLVCLLEEESEVLAAGLGSDLCDLTLGELAELVAAVHDLARAACVEPGWAVPATAAAAETLLGVLEAELRQLAQIHDELYADFTDHVLEIPDAQLRAGERRWRLVARSKLRRRLASVSRTGRLDGDLRTVSRKVLEVRESRRQLASLEPLLSTHLGRRGSGPLADVDAVVGSLAAVRRFQAVLGERLDPDRFAHLLTASALGSPELAEPADLLRAALQDWRRRMDADGVDGRPWTAAELAAWAASTSAALPAITEGAAAMAAIDRPVTTLRDLVDNLLLRERVAELAVAVEAWGDDRHRSVGDAQPGSAS